MEEFLAKHELQLYGMGFPRELYPELLNKLNNDILDAGTFFKIQQTVNENNEFTGQMVVSDKDLQRHSNVFLIDHAWTTRVSSIRDTLLGNYKLLNRMKGLVRIRGEKISIIHEKDTPKVFEDSTMDFDDQGLSEMPQIIPGTLALSLWGNNFSSVTQFEAGLDFLKALWLNQNPISQDEDSLFKYFEDFYPNIEILNSKLTKTADVWALQYLANEVNLDLVTDLDLSDRGVARAHTRLIDHVEHVRSLDLTNNTLTAEYELRIFALKNLKKIKVDQKLEDWAWRNVRRFSCLRYINDFDVVKGRPELVDHVIQKLWAYFNCYRLSTDSKYDENAIWYVLDEFGSSILHSDCPNCKLAPFLYYSPNGESVTYSLLWPEQQVRAGDIIYRDFLPNIKEVNFRSYRLHPWFLIPTSEPLKMIEKWKTSMFQGSRPTLLFLNRKSSEAILEGNSLKISTDLDFFLHSLNDPKFVFSSSEDCDILWTRGKIIDLKAFETDKYLNQFPFETCLVMKNQLAQMIQKVVQVPWFPLTFDLDHEFPAFMGEYLKRQSEGSDNHWIVKPINLTRGIDCQVTNSLDFIIRCMETGPKIVQKYIERPFLLEGRKIDLRFIVLLRSASPLILGVYKHFWIRSANQPFNLSHSFNHSYETHFTVMNYSGHAMKHIKDVEFIQYFEEKTGSVWEEKQQEIYDCIKELFVVATSSFHMEREKSRAIYGIDVMMDQDLQPYLLEVNFCPDCERAIKYYPEFTNQVFNSLFFDEQDGIIYL
jgi:tubulin--tyrosine ligase-like protein 12